MRRRRRRYLAYRDLMYTAPAVFGPILIGVSAVGIIQHFPLVSVLLYVLGEAALAWIVLTLTWLGYRWWCRREDRANG